MVGRTTANRLSHKGLSLVVCAVAVCLPGAAQSQFTLSEVGARDSAAGFAPFHAGRSVVVRGVVNAPAFHFPDYSLLSIEDGQHAAVLYSLGANSRLDAYQPGDEIQVVGTVTGLAGMVGRAGS